MNASINEPNKIKMYPISIAKDMEQYTVKCGGRSQYHMTRKI